MTVKKFRSIYRILVTTALILSALGVMGACVAICLSGSFTPEKVSTALRFLAVPLGLTGLLSLVGIYLCSPEEKTVPAAAPVPAKPLRLLWFLRLATGIIVLGLLIWGLLSGGTADVLAKAANICSECIGLG